ncbi:ribosomal maturation YjgA family protein [Paenibacillus spongiae]|uniref:DUF2809 domain-containing protein n=1 Tax=Paenibacillus spongiae TaxID=2909671 RepID=A0ABY5S5T5_9BACL|nr:DUF2809 domain-containing protein [Paenibacillus spongiae]UVI27915.1 DUF2809 domain-containing protein [Paenibacillus spongiae]
MRIRIGYCVTIAIVIVLGLGSRAYAAYIPDFVSRHAGDVLWASMIYFGFRLILTNRKKSVSAWFAGLFSLIIECSQLYQADWINGVRATTIGALVLGSGFLPADLVRYAAGILAAYVADRFAAYAAGKNKTR